MNLLVGDGLLEFLPALYTTIFPKPLYRCFVFLPPLWFSGSVKTRNRCFVAWLSL
jgi:hypothetical protein